MTFQPGQGPLAKVIERKLRERATAAAAALRANTPYADGPIYDASLNIPRFHANRSIPTISEIREAAQRQFGVSRMEMIGERRNRGLIVARHAAMAVTKQLTPYSLLQIARGFGRGNHATVINALASNKVRVDSGELYNGAPLENHISAIKAAVARE